MLGLLHQYLAQTATSWLLCWCIFHSFGANCCGHRKLSAFSFLISYHPKYLRVGLRTLFEPLCSVMMCVWQNTCNFQTNSAYRLWWIKMNNIFHDIMIIVSLVIIIIIIIITGSVCLQMLTSKMVHSTMPYRRQSCWTQVLDLDKVTVRIRGYSTV